MAETRGVFTLKTVRNNFLNGTYIDPDESFIDQEFSHNTGYHIAGSQSGALGNGSSAVEKLDYATETFTVLASKIADTPGSTAAVGNGEAAYQAGGYGYTAPAGVRSTVNKVTYATDVVARIPALLGPQRYGMGSVGNIGFGFFCGGYNTGNLATSDKLTFATDLIAGVPGANISPARRVLTGASNQEYGFLFGGYTSTYSASVDKIQFNTETRSSAPSLPTATADATAVGNSTKAYITGGNTPSITTQTYSLTFSTGTTSAAPGSNLPTAKNSMTACGTEENAFFMGGPSSSYSTEVIKINYTTGTVSVSPAQLNEGNSSAGGASSQQSGQLNGAKKRNIKGKQGEPRGTYLNGFAATEGYGTGYFVGGPPAGYTVMDRITYATDTLVAVPSARTIRNKQAPGKASTPEHANWIGSTSDTTVERTSYSADCSFEVPSAAIPQTTGYGAGLQNSTAGYMCGGQGPGGPYLSSIQKLTWATDTGSQAPTRLTKTRAFPAGMGNKNIGFLSGDLSPISSVDRIVYATETVNLSPFAFDPVPRAYVGGMSNATDGVVQGGGSPRTSQCRRLNFATESFELIPSSQALTSIPAGGQANGATGNTQNGYSVGGYNGSSYTTNCDRINYSTLTNFRVPSANGSTPRRYLTGCSSQDQDLPTKPLASRTASRSVSDSTAANVGYFGGGNKYPSTFSYVHRANFTTDELERLPAGNLIAARYFVGATGSSTAGYLAGGRTPASLASTEKFTYSAETSALAPSAALNSTRYGVSATGSTSAGYFAGGVQPSPHIATVEKMPYSNDTMDPLPATANLNAAMSRGTGTGNNDYAYFIGGNPAGSIVNKLQFSDDTNARVPSADMVIARYGTCSTGNGSYSYIMGSADLPAAGGAMEKLSFSTDTCQLVGSLGTRRSGAAATTNGKNGMCTGTGYSTTYYSSTDKINFSTDLGSLLPSANTVTEMGGQGGFSPRDPQLVGTQNVI